jgi:hypothetical protein
MKRIWQIKCSKPYGICSLWSYFLYWTLKWSIYYWGLFSWLAHLRDCLKRQPGPMILSHHLIIFLLKNVVQLQEDWLFKTGNDWLSLGKAIHMSFDNTLCFSKHSNGVITMTTYVILWGLKGAKTTSSLFECHLVNFSITLRLTAVHSHCKHSLQICFWFSYPCQICIHWSISCQNWRSLANRKQGNN